MKRIPERIIQEILSRSEILHVVGDYVRLEKRGSRWVGLCPFHNEKTPSFGVNEDRGFFYCFGCHKGGDVITFVKEYEKCGYVEALERLAEKAGITIEYEGEEDAAAVETAKKRDALYELYERLAGTFNHLLVADPRGKRALDYAHSRRLDTEAISSFRLGYVPAERPWLHKFLKSRSYSDDFLADSGLFSRKYPDYCIFTDRLVFPISDARGKIIGFGGRLLSGDGPKYINSPETAIFHKQDTLFGLARSIPAMRTSGEAILCEGYMDVMALHAAGASNAVAPLGTAFTEPQALLLKRYVSTVILCFDTDAAGRKAAERAIGIAESKGMSVKAMKISGAKDPAEMLEKYGPERLKKETQSTITSDDYVLENAKEIAIKAGAEGPTVAFDYLFPFIAAFTSDIRRDSVLERAATRLGVDPESVRADYFAFQSSGQKFSRREKIEPATVTTFAPGSDAALIAAIVANPHLYVRARAYLSPADFEDESLKDALIVMEECYRQEELSVATVVSRLADEGLRAYILEGAATGTYAVNPERFVDDGLYRVRERAMERQKKKIVARIRDYDPTRDGDELSLNDLLYEKMYLDGELTRIKDERHGRS
jgi:DNA primase